MATVALIACAKTKLDREAPAALLYNSPLFKKSLLYAVTNADRSYILSAKHGLLDIETPIAPYELTLKTLTRHEKDSWATRVLDRLNSLIKPKDTIIFLAGQEYQAGLAPSLSRMGCKLEFPLGRSSLGNRLRLLATHNQEGILKESVREFYSIMATLSNAQEGGRLLSECNGRIAWPTRGVYFFIDDIVTAPAPHFMPRISRIGTHAVSAGSKTTLWHRLSTHKGTTSGGGSHRSSIFRLHVGRALLAQRSDLNTVDSWGVGQTAPNEVRTGESALELAVSDTIGRMRVLWLDIGDLPASSSDRAFIEQNSIGLLSRHNVLFRNVSSDWLGNSSADFRITLSGLWNLNHLFSRLHPEFLPILRAYTKATISRTPSPENSLAPPDWGSHADVSKPSSQLKLFPDDKN